MNGLGPHYPEVCVQVVRYGHEWTHSCPEFVAKSSIKFRNGHEWTHSCPKDQLRLWPLGISIFCYGNVTGFVDGSLGLLCLLGLLDPLCLLGLLGLLDPLDPLGLFFARTCHSIVSAQPVHSHVCLILCS